MIKLYSISLGCPKNRVDTEKTLGALGPVSHVQKPEEADLVFINTCGFILPAVQESVRTIIEVTDGIQEMPAGKKPFLVVAGCLVGRYGIASLKPDLPEVDLFLDSHEQENWAESLCTPLGLTKSNFPTRLLSTGPAYAWLKISDGCRHKCAFCTIPDIRGKLRSTSPDVLVRESEELLAQGVKELVLVAQDVTAYGRDTGNKNSLEHLLEKLLSLSGLERLRLMYLYPAGLTDELLGFLQKAGPPFVPYFDVPLQHAAPAVLAGMGRPFAGNPAQTIDKIRNYFPDAAIRTTLITGFPGESPDDFSQLFDFVLKSRFHHLGVFAYQAEEGTSAAAMPDQIAQEIKEERQAEIMRLQAEISEEILEGYVGAKLDILVDAPQGEWPGLYTGRAWFQAPECDGITYISGPTVTQGAIIEAHISEAKEYDLVTLEA